MNAKSVLVVVSMGAFACASASATNVLVNPGFEDGLTSWSGGGAIRGGDPTPHGGLAYLFGGAVSSYYTYQMLTPATMGVSEADIDAGLVEIDFGGWQAGWGTQRDEGKIEIKFLDGASATLAAMDLGWFHSNHTWTERSGVTVAPAGTRFVVFGFHGLRHDGSNCDAYLDDAFVIPQLLPSGSTLAMFALAMGAARRRR